MPVFASGDGAVRFAVIGYARKSVDGRLDKLLEQLRVWLEPASRARPPADLAFDVNIGEKMHLDFDHAVALTILAAAALQVKAKPSTIVTAYSGGR